jgi:methionyl-tRNA formyltransferase
MRIILWIGNEANQKALANKIHKDFPLTGIVIENRKHKVKITFKKLLEKAFEKLFLSSISKSWLGMKKYYENNFFNFPDTKILEVSNINSDEAYEFTKSLNPDLILVSGTRLVKEKMLSVNPKIGILNLHTGFSPYIKGGPNCTNWCIAKQQFHLIGNTVMWIDKGIDSGNILTSELTRFEGNETLNEIHIKVMEHAHSLYVKAVHFIASGKTNSVPQHDIDKGKTYYTKDWTLREKIKLIFNLSAFRRYFKSLNTAAAKQTAIEIKI